MMHANDDMRLSIRCLGGGSAAARRRRFGGGSAVVRRRLREARLRLDGGSTADPLMALAWLGKHSAAVATVATVGDYATAATARREDGGSTDSGGRGGDRCGSGGSDGGVLGGGQGRGEGHLEARVAGSQEAVG